LEENYSFNHDYFYKTISSHVTHVAPTPDNISKQIEVMMTPSLPIDKIRYIDFI
jgi:hypothetical protein